MQDHACCLAVCLHMSVHDLNATCTAQVITLKVGFNHDVRYTLPDALRAFLPEPTLIGLYGIDKNQARHQLSC